MRSLWLAGFLLLVACDSGTTPPVDGGLADTGPGPSDGGADAGLADSGPALTYHRDIKGIIEGRCSGCHAAGGIAPVDLSQAEVVMSYRASIEAHVRDRVMPPWHAEPGCNQYSNDRSLEDEYRQTILDWAALGGPLGDPSVPANDVPAKQPPWGEPDLRLRALRAHTPTIQDEYRCFVLDWPESTDKYVTGIRVEPENSAIVHHANIYYLPNGANAAAIRARAPDYGCYGGVVEDDALLLGSWAPGSAGLTFPENTGLLVQPGSLVVMEMHFNTGPGREGSDQSTVGFKLADTVERRAFIAPIFDYTSWPLAGGMPIPAGQETTHSFELEPSFLVPVIAPWLPNAMGSRWEIHAAGLHMHELGKTAKLHLRRGNGGDDCVVQIPDWDFDWQYGYFLEQPMTFEVGRDRFFLECTWDNTGARHPQGRPVEDVDWGAGSRDEMCIGYLYITEQ